MVNVDFLGFTVDADGIHPAGDKIWAINEASEPKSKVDFQVFLGLLNFYHAFLPHKAVVAEPLHRLLDKKAPWTWGRWEAGPICAVKDLLVSNSVLAHFDKELPVNLACDTSPYGIGMVLGHRLPIGQEMPWAYYSRTLSSVERNYAQIDKEDLAIVAGVKKNPQLSLWQAIHNFDGPQAAARSLHARLPYSSGSLTPRPAMVDLPGWISVLPAISPGQSHGPHGCPQPPAIS